MVVMVVAITAVLGLLKAIRLSAEVIGLKQRLTDDERELSREINMVEQTLQNQLDAERRERSNLYIEGKRYTDIRVDKLEAKLTGTIKSSKEVLKG